jgi:hypothetical protein
MPSFAQLTTSFAQSIEILNIIGYFCCNTFYINKSSIEGALIQVSESTTRPIVD